MKGLNYQRPLFLAYDIASNAFVYGKMSDLLLQGRAGVQTSGASVTINAVTAGVGAFSSLRPGDFVWFPLLQVLTRRRVATVPSPDQITVDSAIDLSTPTAAWHYRQFDGGAAANDGAVPVHFLDAETLCVKVDINAVGGGSTNIEVQIQARAREDVDGWDTIRTVVYPVASGPVNEIIPVRNTDQNAILASSVRVGLRYDVADGGAASDIDVALMGAMESS